MSVHPSICLSTGQVGGGGGVPQPGPGEGGTPVGPDGGITPARSDRGGEGFPGQVQMGGTIDMSDGGPSQD